MSASTCHLTAIDRQPKPITAPWAIAETARLGGQFLKWLFCDAGIVRRQTTFLLAARGWLSNPEGIVAQLDPSRIADPAVALADLLRSGRPGEVIAAAYGSKPAGLIQALNRLGPDALADPAKYEMFFGLFADRRHRPKVRAAQYLGRLTAEKLDVLFSLDPALLSVKMLKRDLTLEQVSRLNKALTAIRAASDPADEDALVAAALAGDENRTIEQFVSAWVRRCRLAPLPFDGDPEAGVYPITTAADLMTESVRFKNCARSLGRVVDAVAGRNGYVVHEDQGRPVAMTALVRFEDGQWAIENVYGPSNDRVPSEIQAPIRRWFAERGVGTLRRQRLQPEWAATLELVGFRTWRGFGDDDPELLED
ncbi:hypothetical protein [Brevundimonas sp.]|uniref:hypothetical protein n=1 Tax=Brevundimonas sp. TaxID=1871086 RepID=UPI0026258265|nr:hypothetical protein [Brevundimonas sp.]